MDKVMEHIKGIKWTFALDDPRALDELERRIARRGRRGGTLTYSELAEGVPFELPGFKDSPHLIDVHDWQEIDRALVGDFLGYISARSYERSGIFASALVVNKDGHVPGDGFYRLLVMLGLIPSASDEMGPVLWAKYKDEAIDWFRQHK